MTLRILIALGLVATIGIYVIVESWFIHARPEDLEELRRNETGGDDE